MSDRVHALMTRKMFEDRVKNALPGEKITYHVGFLFVDAQLGGHLHFMTVFNTSKAAWEAMEAGQVNLVQRKIMEGAYEYIAIKRPKPHKKVEWVGCYAPDWGEDAPSKPMRYHGYATDKRKRLVSTDKALGIAS